ncbi:MAG: exodeoxyribonuclease V subunit gamma [Bacteroidetes bacterium]|jgi:DNA helicase-2/ATP-dependent DNA helicase PcrA|nr:exodeoxyribonuclease V subunit gamma [Bacteroidota bacterium]MBK9301086.1 exodeoxyribonuclease V subunit gamma [Bacteroidota bacterium]MBK9480785.1 exodeoxyribonuclease V subunit gamma [Bacteroidota bacterium]
MQEYLKSLNENQHKAVIHTEGPLMIVAGAGSGKTKVLTSRIAHLIHLGVDSFRILALTFTNKAAKEMKERIEHMLGNSEARNLFIGTFHSVFSRILRVEATRLGYPANFTIYDTDDAKSVIKAIVKEKNLDDKTYKASIIYNRISSAKNNLYTYREYQADAEIQQEDARSNRPLIGQIFEAYSKRCFKNGAMDFDDLLVNMYILLSNFPEALSKYQTKFRYVMIDEYQDTNLAQYHIVKLLGAMHENICVVGDDAQSIYSFRGASMENIFQFQKDYDDVTVIKLEQNYRSTRNIIEAANQVIAKNENQIKKNLWTEKESGDKIKLVCSFTDNDEGKYVADAISELKIRNHYQNQQIAILYRTNAQSRAFEESFRRANIAYKIYGGLSFYQRKEIKDFVCYLRCVANPQDEEALKRIINYPARGIGTTTLNKISVFAQEKNITYWQALNDLEPLGFKGATLSALQNFVMMIKHFQLLQDKKNAYELAEEIGKLSGLVKELYIDKTVEGLARYENLQELLNSIKEYTETPTEDGELVERNLGSYLQQITLLTDTDNDNEEDQNTVKLMTIHAAKGLEFPIVFLVGMEENIFPSQMSMYDREDLEEERRLFYVAITRAKEKLYISFANNRYRFGSLVQNDPSRFIDELPADMVDNSLASKPRFNTPKSKGLFGNENAIQQKKVVNHHTTATHTATAQFKPDDPSKLQEGMRVEHQRFGFGKIITLEGPANNKIATINFEPPIGQKKIMLNYAKLSIVA